MHGHFSPHAVGFLEADPCGVRGGHALGCDMALQGPSQLLTALLTRLPDCTNRSLIRTPRLSHARSTSAPPRYSGSLLSCPRICARSAPALTRMTLFQARDPQQPRAS
ncbi:hypothetical protein FA95DRAFT_1043204 [Auriscalpium vulgare]|uniref:Uncharacterized protein n=1 Tax=Auriscalpium vulgare TaxID=40419 RepID=A0ACB8R5M9_9AGAM|nr:hypothetical protein FA95DRAFT_1043204 [Auriscalpium vulgare]